MPRSVAVTTRRLACAVLLLACPQLLEDEFGTGGSTGLSAGAGGATGSTSAGVGGTGPALTTAGGAAGAAGAGAGGAGGSASGGAPDGGASAGCTAFGEFTDPALVTGLGRAGALWGPSLSADGTTLAFSEQLNNVEDIFLSIRTANGAFGPAQPAPGINSPAANEGTPFLSDDGTSFYFYSDRIGGTGGRDLYVATRPRATGPFGMPGQVPGINSTFNEHLLWLSSDELEIYFTSNRAGGAGAYDLYHGTRVSRTAAFTPITNLTGINSPEDDEAPSLSGDELTLVFASSRSGSSDIWMATRETSTATFGSLGPVLELNSDDYESNVTLSHDGREVIFASDRGGTSQLYRATRDCR